MDGAWIPGSRVSIGNVTVANAIWGKAKTMAKIESVDLDLSVLPHRPFADTECRASHAWVHFASKGTAAMRIASNQAKYSSPSPLSPV